MEPLTTKIVLKRIALLATSLFLFVTASCRKEPEVIPITPSVVGEGLDNSEYAGLYLLNEGNMGSNKASLDYLDFASGTYLKNIYPTRNPEVTLELGDVGNDIAIYGSKLYLVINASNKVEVLHASNAKKIGQITIPNCRYITFHEGNAYVTSYVAPVQLDPNAPKGAVYQIDTATLQVSAMAEVGYQPEEITTDGEYLYVANSGGYRTPHYDNTISVVSLASMREEEKIPVAINLHRIERDHRDQLWVSSRGDYKEIPSSLVVLKRQQGGGYRPADTLNISCSGFAIQGDSLYYYGSQWSNKEQRFTTSFGIVNILTHQVVSEKIFKPHPEVKIKTPYSIAIYGRSGDIFITDATDFTSSGRLYCFSKEGEYRWQAETGDIPGQVVFLPKHLATEETTALQTKGIATFRKIFTPD